MNNYHQSQQSRRHQSSQQQYGNRSRSNYRDQKNDNQHPQQHHYNTSSSGPHVSSSRNNQVSSNHPSHSRSSHAHSHQNLHQSSQMRSHRIPAGPMNKTSSQSATNLHSAPLRPHHHSQSPHPHSSKMGNSSSSKSHSHSKGNNNDIDSDTKFIRSSTARIIDLANINPKSDTADLIQRSVRQHVEYQKRLKQHEAHIQLLQQQQAQASKGGNDVNNIGLSKIDDQNRKIMDYIQQLTELENREHALSALSKLRENNPDLAPLLWGTPAVIAALIQEVISVYPYLSGNIEMNSNHSNRCCNALALLQCVASHPETRGLFLKAYIPLFLYPFLNTELNSRPFEYLRLTSLGVIGALVKHPHPNISSGSPSTNVIIPDSEVTEFLVKTEAIPLCLHIMEYGNELSQTVATFIIQKILLDDYGLNYVCKTSDRFFAISQVLTKMIQDSSKKPSKKLIKHVVRCYLRLCDDNRAYLALHSVLPKYLQSTEVETLIGDDESCLQWLKQLRNKHKQSLIAQQEDQRRRKANELRVQQQQQLTQQQLNAAQQQQRLKSMNNNMTHHHQQQQLLTQARIPPMTNTMNNMLQHPSHVNMNAAHQQQQALLNTNVMNVNTTNPYNTGSNSNISVHSYNNSGNANRNSLNVQRQANGQTNNPYNTNTNATNQYNQNRMNNNNRNYMR